MNSNLTAPPLKNLTVPPYKRKEESGGTGIESNNRHNKRSPAQILLIVIVAMLTFSSINCNSLNMSMSSKCNQALKIQGITKLNTDIIFLSDIRLSNKYLVSAANDIEKMFLSNPIASYTFMFNSTKNKRGVGILIKKGADISVQDRWDEPDENALLLKVTISGETFVIGSIYGPNEVCPIFFERLKIKLTEWNLDKIVLGGDWNCLFSTDNVAHNLDCINMLSCPNQNNSIALNDVCTDLMLFDPFRYLHPDKRDYTYLPRVRDKKNRSRLDFFIVSCPVLNSVTNCKILPAKQNCLFDHKAIELELGKKNTPVRRQPRINNANLNIDILEILVETTVAETYLIHLEEGELEPQVKADLLLQVGLLKRDLRAVPYPYELWPNNSYDAGDVVRRILQMEQIRNRCDGFDLENLKNLKLSTDSLFFMEVLLNNVRNETIGFQVHFRKWKTNVVTGMKRNLETLKQNYDANFEKIEEVEWKLNLLIDNEAKNELENYSVFEVLNMEKMTPAFLNIAKQTKQAVGMCDILDDTGSAFNTDEDRKRYITDYYAQIYKVKDDTTDDTPGCIERFLGPVILDSPEVQNSRLNDRQRESLETNLTIAELDESIKAMNSKTAGGPDGVGVPVLKKFWKFFRVPLWKYSNDMMQVGSMSPSFKTSTIKLIPKKGDSTKIKNWRPISLLNVSYKVISKAINNRLKKVSAKILSRAQKGFTSNKYIQECLINLIEFTGHCNKSKTPGFVLAIDQAKAFDTVSHNYIKEVYKFFGFGPNFTKLLEITTMGRNATILFDDGSTSEPINLGTGFTQGNGPSPLLFNFCQQILIFKIELCSVIETISWPELKINNCMLQNQPRRNQEPAPAPEPILPGEQQQQLHQQLQDQQVLQHPQHPKGKVEGFADDTSVLGKAKRESLIKIKQYLMEFAKVSGLKVNFDKCILIPVGMQGAVPDYFYEFGFKVDNRAVILGVTISNNLSELSLNFDIVIEKILHLRNFWGRFNLSLPGRLAIAKTLMLSRLGYLATFLDPNNDQLCEIKSLIYGFVKGKLNVSNERITVPVNLGGLGMIDIDDYALALKVSWIRRAVLNNDDLWSRCLLRLGYTEPDRSNLPVLCPELFPVLSGIASAGIKFCLAALKADNNILESKIEFNLIFGAGQKGTRFQISVFEQIADNNQRDVLKNLRIGDIVRNGSIYTKAELDNTLGFSIPDEIYRTLVIGVKEVKAKKFLVPVTDTISRPTKLSDIITKPKKGSKLYRKYFTRLKGNEKPINFNVLKKFVDLTGAQVENLRSESKFFNNKWRITGLSNKLCEFAFKFTNNLLGLNCRVNHFNRYVNEGCTFCTLNSDFPVPRETFNHLFFHCPETAKTLSSFEGEYLNSLNLDTLDKRRNFWFFCFNDNQRFNKNIFLTVTVLVILFYVWDCKLQKKRQSLMSCLNFYFFHMETARKLNSCLRNEMNNLNLDLCRYWNGERRRGW
jgi:exonuclease III